MSLERKIETFLGEFRSVVPGVAALLGFQLIVAFQPSFRELPESARAADLAGILCTLLALGFLTAPAGYHRFTNRLDQSASFVNYARHMMSLAFAFLPFGMALSLYVQTLQVFDSVALALVVAFAVLLLLGILWWFVPWMQARRVEE